MTFLKVACVQMHVDNCQKQKNISKVLKMAIDAIKLGAQIIIFPEVFSTGFCYEDLDNIAEQSPFPTLEQLVIFSSVNSCVLIGSIIEKQLIAGKVRYYNMGFCIENGIIVGYYRKSHLFQNERNYFTAGDILAPIRIQNCNLTIGLEICYELRFPEIARKVTLNQSDILVTIAQFPNPRNHIWKSLVMARAIENQIPHIACNVVGQSTNLSYFGSSMIVDASGIILSEARDAECIVYGVINLASTGQVRSTINVFTDRRPNLYRS